MPVRRLCVCIICGYRWGAMARVMFAVGLGEAVWYGVSSIQAAMAPPRGRPWPPFLSPKHAVVCPSIWVEHIWMCQTVWRKYGLYLWYVTTFCGTSWAWPTTYIRTLWEYILDSEPHANVLGNYIVCGDFRGYLVDKQGHFVDKQGGTLLTSKGTLVTNMGTLVASKGTLVARRH